jgi:FAD/FMN-containing dehydrogenase/Fe-S oxidoreductase
MVQTDTLTRRLYANDASMYEELPAAVAFPKTETDIRDLVLHARNQGVAITARAAGTSLAGQTTGGGIVMDTGRHMTRILRLDPDAAYATVQPGVIRDTLNRAAAMHGLQFGPDTSTTNRCMIGGMIGNNSAGSFSLKHRTTREHVTRMRVVLSDGQVVDFEPLSESRLNLKTQLDSLEGQIYRQMLALLNEHADLIREHAPHPDIIRRNTGYALDRLLEMAPFTPGGRPFNLCELLCGSEGTLAMTVDADVRLVPLPTHKILLVPHFATVDASMEATVLAVRMAPAAVELVDKIVLDATRNNAEQARNRFFLEGDPGAILAIQFEGEDMAEVRAKADACQALMLGEGRATAAPILTDTDGMNRVWELRKAGLGLLMGVWAETKTPEFMEDTAVRVEDLPAYIRDIEALCARYGVRCVYYAHASVGELHLRPELNLTVHEGLEMMKAMAVDVADIVKRYRGSLSGEHGDGRVRAPFLERFFGREMIALFERVKDIWDPHGIFNPGKIVFPKPMDADLRFHPGVPPPTVESVFEWRDESGGFMEALNRCNGAGVCRKLADSGGTMCPSYMATREEKDSTRGRANLFRQLFRGQGPDAFTSPELKDGLALCLSCKACKTECPANVDMARMKAEFLHGWHQRNGSTLAERFFAFPERLYPLAARMPRLVNAMNRTRPMKEVYKTLFQIAPERDLPSFAHQSFWHWYRKRATVNPEGIPVVILNDLFMNDHEPEIGRAMVAVLEAMGRRVIVTEPHQSGRTYLSKGFLDHARKASIRTVEQLRGYARRGIAIIGQEPSELLTLRDETLDLVPTELLDDAAAVAAAAVLFEEYIIDHADEAAGLFDIPPTVVAVHGHCHAKALIGTHPTMQALALAGYLPQDLKTGCCGMAGSFGYEADHYPISVDIAETSLLPALRSLPAGTTLCAHGFSCRHQIADLTTRTGTHPAVLLLQALKR